MKKKIAVIEDDDLIRNMIKMNMERSGYEVQDFVSAEQARSLSEGEFFDVIILDVVLPGISGFEFLTEMRKEENNTPVLMLTVQGEVTSRLKAFDRGVDDYMVKPFNMDELSARVKALIRRSQEEPRLPAGEFLVINGRQINTLTRVCEGRSGSVDLSEKEVNLLIYLTGHPHEVLTRADILEEVWGMDVAPTPRTIDNFILKFRRLFEDNPEKPRHFISVRSKGYRFEK
ncbi:MAG: response regulator transcription factor [Candidatus Aminicenantes bacterium]|nr:response regulator transcription factor [Candidatus Aminicenantes bacterium]